MFLFHCKDNYCIKLNKIPNETMKCTHHYAKDYKLIYLLRLILSAIKLGLVDLAEQCLMILEQHDF